MLSPYKLFKIYHAVNLHFNSSYDLFKYNQKTSTTKDIFENRKDCLRFDYWVSKIQSPEEALAFCVFNRLRDKNWLYNSYDEAKDCYLQHKKIYSTFSKYVREEYDKIQKIKDERKIKFEALIQPTVSGDKPPLLQLYLQHRISIEFLCVIDLNYSVVDLWCNKYINDPLISEELGLIKKYTPFVRKFSNK